jgi:hypothetical protein
MTLVHEDMFFDGHDHFCTRGIQKLNQENQTMNTRSLPILTLAVCSLSLLPACNALLSAAVKSKLNMNSSAPNFAVDPAVAALGDAERFFAEVLADADNGFLSFKGDPLTTEEKSGKVASMVAVLDGAQAVQLDRGHTTSEGADSVSRAMRRVFSRGDYAHLSQLPPGAEGGDWGAFEQPITVTNMISDNKSVSFLYPIATKEEGRALVRHFSDLFNRVLPEPSRWVVLDVAGMRADYVEMAGYNALSAKHGGKPPYDFETLSSGPISTVTFSYRWTSQATIKIRSETPAIDQVHIIVHNNLEDDEYNYFKVTGGGNLVDGEWVMVTISKTVSVNGN